MAGCPLKRTNGRDDDQEAENREQCKEQDHDKRHGYGAFMLDLDHGRNFDQERCGRGWSLG